MMTRNDELSKELPDGLGYYEDDTDPNDLPDGVHPCTGVMQDSIFDDNRKKHASLHKKGTAKYIELKCGFCGEKFQKRHKDWITKHKNGQKSFYCNRSCSTKKQFTSEK